MAGAKLIVIYPSPRDVSTFERAYVQDQHHVLALEPGGCARFPHEPLDDDRVACEVGLQDLDRDLLVQVHSRGLVDDRHAAFAQLALDTILAVDEGPGRHVLL